MSNQATLEQAISKAIDGGWNKTLRSHRDFNHVTSRKDSNWLIFGDTAYEVVHPNELIYNHEFAKALWGDSNTEHHWGIVGHVQVRMPDYKYHLQQLVISEDPIKYLGENI